METRPITPLAPAAFSVWHEAQLGFPFAPLTNRAPPFAGSPPLTIPPQTTKRLPSERGYGIPRNRRFLEIRNITIATATPTTTAELTPATMISGGEPEAPDDGR